MAQIPLNPRLLKTLALALGTTSLFASFAATPAHAIAVSCMSSTVASGSDFASAGAAGTMCSGSKITNTNTNLPAYWSFQWGGASADATITGTVKYNPANETGLTMNLYDSMQTFLDGTFLATTNFITYTGNFTYDLSNGQTYYVSIDNLSEPYVQVGFTQGTSPVPLPASLPMLGVALAALGFAARVRKANA